MARTCTSTGMGFAAMWLRFQQEHVAARECAGGQQRQTVHRDVLQVVGHEVQEARVGPERARMHASLGHEAHVQRAGSVLVLLVGQQALNEDVARLAWRQLLELFATASRSRGSRLSALISSSVEATNRKSLATSRSRLSMRDTSARYWSAICVMEIAPISTFCRLTRYSKRSNGPSKLSMRTLYDMDRPATCQRRTAGRTRCRPSRPDRCR